MIEQLRTGGAGVARQGHAIAQSTIVVPALRAPDACPSRAVVSIGTVSTTRGDVTGFAAHAGQSCGKRRQSAEQEQYLDPLALAREAVLGGLPVTMGLEAAKRQFDLHGLTCAELQSRRRHQQRWFPLAPRVLSTVRVAYWHILAQQPAACGPGKKFGVQFPENRLCRNRCGKQECARGMAKPQEIVQVRYVTRFLRCA